MEKSIISFRQPFYQQRTVYVFNEYRFGLGQDTNKSYVASSTRKSCA